MSEARKIAQHLIDNSDNPEAGAVYEGVDAREHPEIQRWLTYLVHGIHYDDTGYLVIPDGEILRWHRRGRLVIRTKDGHEIVYSPGSFLSLE